MKHLVLLTVLGVMCALVGPSWVFAQEESTTTTPTTPTETEAAPPAPAPAPPAPAPAPPPPEEPQELVEEPEAAPEPAPQIKAIAAASGSVTIADFSFAPASLTVNQGDTVTWVNNGPTPHSATANNGSFNTGILKAGQSASHTFGQAGTFSYYCQPHPYMKATIVVQAAQTGGTDTGGSDGSGSAGATDTGSAGTDTGATAAQADDGPTLPNTGGDAAPLLILGGLMLLLGIAMHRRAAEREPRPAGRIGW